MPTYNYKSRELIAKIVYYGPGRCGKTTNLQQIHQRMRPETRSELLSVATETDRTIYFDLLPLNLGTISGMKFMVRLFTVPGQVYYAETRKLVLRGADGIVFVADSQDHMMDENRQSLRDLRDNLASNGLDYSTIPLVFQWNKRDLPHLISEAELDATLNDRRVKTVNSIAAQGDGVLETLRHVTLSVFNHIKAGGKSMKPARAGQHTPVPGASSGASSNVGMGASASRSGSAGASGPHGETTDRLQGAEAPRATTPPGSWSAALPRPSIPNYGTREPSSSGHGGSAGPRNGPSTAPPPPPIPSTPPLPAGRGTPPRLPDGPHAPSGSGGGSYQIHQGAPSASYDDNESFTPHGPQPVKISVEMVLEEFQSLAMAQSQMSERMATLEHRLTQLSRENQEIREMLARR
ncbi:MAG: hypothetical protein H6729_02955 [Deltaproteobacteria bacterium]|nr:hypothetical protein [Deltaproteobacteria bacterium]